MTDDSFFEEPKLDEFKSESPLRAFAQYDTSGGYLIAKGFRPSLKHLTRYLAAMEEKEGWQLLQILEAASGVPTLVFRSRSRKDTPLPLSWSRDGNTGKLRELTVHYNGEEVKLTVLPIDVLKKGFIDPEKEKQAKELGFKDITDRAAWRYEHIVSEVTSENPVDVLIEQSEKVAEELGIDVDYESFQMARERMEEIISQPPEAYIGTKAARDLGFPPDGIEVMEPGTKIVDDPINPNHYAGRECADIGERLSANGYQILKYCWRLGKKDDPCQELGKALWYLDSEIALLNMKGYPNDRMSNRRGLKGDTDQWIYGRLNGQSEFTRKVAMFLWDGYNVQSIGKLKAMIADHKATLDCGHGLAI